MYKLYKYWNAYTICKVLGAKDLIRAFYLISQNNDFLIYFKYNKTAK